MSLFELWPTQIKEARLAFSRKTSRTSPVGRRRNRRLAQTLDRGVHFLTIFDLAPLQGTSYTAKLTKLIEAKAKGKKDCSCRKSMRKPAIINLMDALRQKSRPRPEGQGVHGRSPRAKRPKKTPYP